MHQIVVKTQVRLRRSAAPTLKPAVGRNYNIRNSQSSLPFPSVLSFCGPLALYLPSSALRKERQTHFHTNGVRACSPGTRWNCKYFIFAREPHTITPQPLSPRFHSLPFCRCPSFICSPACLTAAVHHSRWRSSVQISLFDWSKTAVTFLLLAAVGATPKILWITSCASIQQRVVGKHFYFEPGSVCRSAKRSRHLWQ